MIRQPISPYTRILLGVISVAVLLAGYSWLSFRQHQRNPRDTTIPNASQLAEGWLKLVTREVTVRKVDAARDTVMMIDNRLRVGDRIRFRVVDGEAPPGLADGQIYFAIPIDGDDALVQLARSRADAEAGRVIDLTAPGKGTFTAYALGKIRETWLWIDTKASLFRFAMGIGCGVAISFVLGMAMGCFPVVEALCLPCLSFFAKIPPTAMLAVYFVLFGTDIRLFVALLALGIAPTLAQSICQAVQKDVREHDVHKAYTLGASHMEVIWNVVFRQVLPRILQFIQLQVGPAMVFLIAAEYMLADEGFGYRLRMQSRLVNMNVVYLYLLLLGLAGFGIDWLLTRLRRWLCPWFGD